MSQIISPFMKEAVRLLEEKDVIVNLYLSRLNQIRIDAPDIDDRLRRDYAEHRSLLGLPLEVQEGKVVAGFRFLGDASLKIAGSWEPLTGMESNPDKQRIAEAFRARGYEPHIEEPDEEDEEEDEGGSEVLRTNFISLKYVRKVQTPEEAVEEVLWALENRREFWPDLSWT